MASRKTNGWRRVLVAGLVATSLVAVPVGGSSATEVPDGDIMFIAAHPDDDVILAAGVIDAAKDSGQTVKVAYLTNGDEYDASIGTTRQGEGVAAQALLGMAESDLVFFGYPSTFLDCVRYGATFDPPHCADMSGLPSAVTYASRGLGGTDYHTYRTGSPAAFTQANLAGDMYALLDTYRPDDVFTHAFWDIHSDHKITYLAVIEAIAAISGYDPTVHVGLVHADDPAYPQAWPDFSGASPSLPHTSPNFGSTLTITPTNEWDLLESDTNGELTWEQREAFSVPGSMLNSNAGTNLKYQAVAAHASQFYDTIGLIQRFIHADEVFWTYKVGAPVGVVETYSVDEGGQLSVGGSGVLLNDIRGTGTPPGAPVNPDPLGPLEASLVSAPSHGTLTSWPSDGSFIYTHDGSQNFFDSFIYQPHQGSTYGAFTTVTVNIIFVDEDPTADNDGPFHTSNGSVTVPDPGVLDGDSDPEGQPLTAHLVGNVSHGSLSLSPNGGFTYTHDGSTATSDSFTYVARDPGGNESADATVSIIVDSPDQPLGVTVSGPATGAQGVAQNFAAGVTGGEGTQSYSWVVRHDGSPVGSPSAAPAFSFIPTEPGAYDIELVVSDATGSASDTVSHKSLGDIAGSTFVTDIIWLADERITQGCNPPANDRFCPNDYVTRGQMAAFLVRFLGLTDNGGGDLFDDDNGSIFESDIDKLATAGVTRGCNPSEGNTNFCPSAYVTRGQMAAFLVRALGLTDNGGGDLFDDDNGSIFEDNIDKLATAGVTRGCNPSEGNNKFCPDGRVTRGQMAAFLHRAEDLAGS